MKPAAYPSLPPQSGVDTGKISGGCGVPSWPTPTPWCNLSICDVTIGLWTCSQNMSRHRCQFCSGFFAYHPDIFRQQQQEKCLWLCEYITDAEMLWWSWVMHHCLTTEADAKKHTHTAGQPALEGLQVPPSKVTQITPNKIFTRKTLYMCEW